MREVRARCGAAREIIRQVNDDLGQSEDLEQVIPREPAGHTGHRRMAVDLLIMEALDWDEGELLDEHSARSGGPTSGVRSTVPGSLRTTSAELPGGEPSAINRQEFTGEVRSGPSWGRETAVNNGQSRCPADNQTYSSSAVISRDGAAGPYMACKGSGVQIPSAPPGTTHLPLTLAASSASNLPANDAG
jgi:hypothetical protein